MATKKLKSYHTLTMRLRKAGFKNKGKYCIFEKTSALVNFLFNLYLDNKGMVYKSDLVKYGVLYENETSTNELLKYLNNEKFIKWEITENVKLGLKHYQTFAGEKLVDLINKELKEQYAIESDVVKMRVEIDELKNNKMEFVKKEEFIKLKEETAIKISKLENTIKNVIEKFDPPFTEEKYKKYSS